MSETIFSEHLIINSIFRGTTDILTFLYSKDVNLIYSALFNTLSFIKRNF